MLCIGKKFSYLFVPSAQRKGMVITMENKMNKLWNYIFDVLFCEETNLVYEHRISYDENATTVHLPEPEVIKLQIPNPCGWGTGMEDSATSAGILLDAILNRYSVNHEPEMRLYAKKVFEGIKLCATVSGKRGFLARSVSPVDKKSFYFNTSRDQYTHVIYSLVKYMKSELCDVADKPWIIDTLVDFAQLVEREATPQNDYQLMRADDKVGIVCAMWNVRPHEALRLPMFYLAAWVASGDEHWLELYKAWRDKGIEKSVEYYSTDNMCILVQMQVSIRFLYNYDPDEKYREKYCELLKYTAKFASEFRIKDICSLNVNFLGKPWHECDLKFQWGNIVINGYAYTNPQDPLLNAIWPLMEIGDAISTQVLCPNCKIHDEQIKQLNGAVDVIDIDKHASRAPLRLCAGYWALKTLK